MPLDALHLTLICSELRPLLAGGRIDRITMPSGDTVLLHIHSGTKKTRLLLSVNPAKPRIFLTDLEYQNPPTPPAFCMHLRKYLLGAKIQDITSNIYERVIFIDLVSRNEIGDDRPMRLFVELMGRTSNLILGFMESGAATPACKITDCLKRTPLDTDTVRTVFPGLGYTPPPSDGKINAGNPASLRRLLAGFNGGDFAAYIVRGLEGLSTMTVKELFAPMPSAPLTAAEIDGITDKLTQVYAAVLRGEYCPNLLLEGDRPIEFFAFLTGKTCVRTDSLLAAESAFFSSQDAAELWQKAIAEPDKVLRDAQKKLQKRKKQQEEKLLESAEAEKFRLWGELILSNLWRISPRERSVKLQNFLDDRLIEITLDPQKSAAENAQGYFKKYAKLKRAAEINRALLEETTAQSEVLASIRVSLDNAMNTADVAAVTEELAHLGILKKPPEKGRRGREQKSKPVELAIEGFTVLVGKNNLQNDEITFHLSQPHDIWLHTLHIHGSHVLIKNPERVSVPEAVILAAARLAAFYSAGRHGTKIAVDYTKKKFVTRNGKTLGAVLYTHQTTLIVDPEQRT